MDELTVARLNELITLIQSPSGVSAATRYGVYREIFAKTRLDQMALQAEVASLQGMVGSGAGIANAIDIDHDNNSKELSGWVDSNDGILVYDLNGNGIIDDAGDPNQKIALEPQRRRPAGRRHRHIPAADGRQLVRVE